MKEFAEPIINRPVDDSLVLWILGRGSRREGTVLADLSKKGHHGTLVNSPSWKNTPLGHSVLDLNGTTQYVEVADHADFSFGDGTTDKPFSISAWMNLDDVSDADLVNKKDVTGAEWCLGLLNYVFFSLSDSLTGSQTGRKTGTLSAGQWYHIVGTYDGRGGANAKDGIKLYINGVREDEADYGFGTYDVMDNKTSPVEIGRFVTHYTNGKIDDVRIYRKELTAKEVMEIFNQTKHFYGK